MFHETSYGIIPFRLHHNEWQVLLIRHKDRSHWGFPKGHAERGENSEQAATRELFEETGLSVLRFISKSSLEEHYHFYAKGKHIQKKVVYFLAEVGGTIQLQPEEVGESKWMPLSEAESHITFPEAKSLCRQAIQIITRSTNSNP